MDSALANALTESILFAFVAVDIQLANSRICLTDGLPEVTFPIDGNSVTFTSFDPTYGVLTSFEDVTTGISDEAPASMLSIAPATAQAVAELCDIRNQSKTVNFYFGLYDKETGSVLQVRKSFSWRIDIASLKSGNENGGNVMIDVNLITPSDKFFNSDSGDRLNLTYQQRLRPNETGLKFMTAPQDEVWWGQGVVANVNGKNTPVSRYANIYNR